MKNVSTSERFLFRLSALFIILEIGLSPLTVCSNEIKSARDLEDAMYSSLVASPCIRILNVNGEYGCGNPGRFSVDAAIQRLKAVNDEIPDRRAILIPFHMFHDFLKRVQNDSSLPSKISGLLVGYAAPNSSQIQSFSPFSKFPLSEFAPRLNQDYIWNPSGLNIFPMRYDFPISLLSEESTSELIEKSDWNDKYGFKYPQQVVQFNSVMQTTKTETGNSEACLKAKTCLPLGGFSVLSTLPALDPGFRSEPKPLVLCVATMDTASFFRDDSPGAESPISGMVALLAAVDLLSKITDIDDLPKQLVFAVFTGEAWGYLGSRQFLHLLSTGNSATMGLNFSYIDQVLEIGSIGRSLSNGKLNLFAHLAKAPSGTTLEGTSKILSTITEVAESLPLPSGIKNIAVKAASVEIPVLPPSSLMAFLDHNSTIAGIVLEDFDTEFSNPFFQSHFDTSDKVSTEAIAISATLIGHALYKMAGGSLQHLDISSNASLVADLVSCMSNWNSEGMSCPLVSSLMTPKAQKVSHYSGVLVGDPSATPSVNLLDDTARFVWNFLANVTGKEVEKDGFVTDSSGERVASNKSIIERCSESCVGESQVCVGSKADTKGRCLRSSTRFVPAYSTRLSYDDVDGAWIVGSSQNDSSMYSVDPIWTESFWQSLSVISYLKDDETFEWLLLFVGTLISVCSVCMVSLVREIVNRQISSG